MIFNRNVFILCPDKINYLKGIDQLKINVCDLHYILFRDEVTRKVPYLVVGILRRAYEREYLSIKYQYLNDLSGVDIDCVLALSTCMNPYEYLKHCSESALVEYIQTFGTPDIEYVKAVVSNIYGIGVLKKHTKVLPVWQYELTRWLCGDDRPAWNPDTLLHTIMKLWRD